MNFLAIGHWFWKTRVSIPAKNSQARCRGRSRGELNPPRNFQIWVKFQAKVEFSLLKWRAVNGSYSFQVLSIIVRLCTVVLLCNLELRKVTESYFFSGKKQATALKYLPLIFHQNRRKQNRAKCTNDNPELGLLDFIGILRGPPV